MVSEKRRPNQVPKELPSKWSEKANTHEHGTKNTRPRMFSMEFRGGRDALGWGEQRTRLRDGGLHWT